jgi:hypothetical protein
MAINAGVNISKFNGYAVLAPNPGVDITKFGAYAVLAPLAGVDVTKFGAYAVLASTIVAPPLWGSWTFADGTFLIPYSQSWDMPTSATTVTYSVLSGALPNGLSLTALTGNQAKVSGTPTALGPFSFTLRAHNTFGTVDKAFSITINPNTEVVPVAVVLQGGVTGMAYSETIGAQGGSGSYTFAVTAGSLPTSLSLAGGTGIISGTPSAVGTFSFTITATDTLSQTGTQNFSITITAPSGGGGAGASVIFA